MVACPSATNTLRTAPIRMQSKPTQAAHHCSWRHHFSPSRSKDQTLVKCFRPPAPHIKLSWEMIEAAGSPAAYLPMPYSSVGQVHCRTGSVSKHNDLVSKQAAQTHNLTGQCTSALLSHSTHHSLLMCCDPKGATPTALLPLPQLTHKLAEHKNSSTPAQSRISRTCHRAQVRSSCPPLSAQSPATASAQPLRACCAGPGVQ